MPTTIETLNRDRTRRVSGRAIRAQGRRFLVAFMLLCASVLVSPPVQANADEVAAETLVLVNLIRQRLTGCREDGAIVGRDLTSASIRDVGTRAPLTWNPRLADIARQQAEAMVNQQFFSHLDTSGHSIGTRAVNRGYRWRLIGENLASGQRNLASAMRGWLQSFTHCRNLIDERFTEVGLARVDSTDPDDVYGTYWVMVLGKPAPHQRAPTQPVLLAQTERTVTAALFAALN